MKLGIIGIGNMGTAIINGYLTAGSAQKRAGSIFVVGHDSGKTKDFAAERGLVACGSIGELTAASDIILIAVKPKDVAGVMAEISPELTPEKMIVSIAAGLTIGRLQTMAAGGAEVAGQAERGSIRRNEAGDADGTEAAGRVLPGNAEKIKVIRVMPNTPAMVGCGMSALCRSESVTEEDFAFVLDIFRSIGEAEEVPESLMDAVTGVSGSGPAFVYLFIEALADGAVLAGLPRAKATKFAAQTVLGSAKMVLETGSHPGELKDAVCSPAGTTIEGVRALEQAGFRSAAMGAVIAAAEKSKSM